MGFYTAIEDNYISSMELVKNSKNGYGCFDHLLVCCKHNWRYYLLLEMRMSTIFGVVYKSNISFA